MDRAPEREKGPALPGPFSFPHVSTDVLWIAVDSLWKAVGRFLDAGPQTSRSCISFLISMIAAAGFSPFGQTLAQFMIVWQR